MILLLIQLFSLCLVVRSSSSVPRRIARGILPPAGAAKVDVRYSPGFVPDVPSNDRRGVKKRRVLGPSYRTDTAPEPLTFYNERYVIPIDIGDQTFHLALDTGSQDIWVLSSALPASETSGRTVYVPSNSAVDTNRRWHISYADGSFANGVVYNDTIAVGNFVIEKQGVYSANFINGTLLNYPVDGLIGMSLATKESSGDTSVLSNLQSHGLQSSVFTCALVRPNERDVQGFCTFGYVYGTSPVAYADVIIDPVDNPNNFWMFPSTTAKIGSTVIQRPKNKAIADTGTYLIEVDDALLKEIYGSVNGKQDSTGFWMYPQNASFPSITLPVGGFDITLNPGDIDHGPAAKYPGYNYGTIQSRGSFGADIFGDIWLNNVYAVFDATPGRPRFGVIPRAYGKPVT